MGSDEKNKGSIGELKFSLEAMIRGWNVSIPIGDNCKYDLVVEKNGVLSKIQVKSVYVPSSQGRGYHLSISHGSNTKQAYSIKDVDMIACYIAPLNLFYLIPIKELCDQKTVRIFPYSNTSKYARFKENWHFV